MKLGFIGCGNMAKAIMKGILASGIASTSDVFGSNSSQAHADEVAAEFGIGTSTNNLDVVRNSDVIFLSVKPCQYADVIAEVRDEVSADKVIVTIAPGKTFAWLTEQFGKDVKIVRTAPNTPAHVLAGLTGYCPNDLVTEEELAYVKGLLESFGTAVAVTESQLDATASVGGSSPAFTYMFIEAMADAGVAEGLKRDQAYQMAAQAVMGAAKMVLESGKHPGQLKDEVCSPSGSTIKGVEALENGAFRGTVISAMRTTINAARSL